GRDGAVWAWGSNSSGQLGVATPEAVRHEPAVVPGLADIVAVSAGGTFSAAVARDGRVWAWGNNADGQLGVPEPAQRTAPGLVPGLADVVAIATGRSHCIARTRSGDIYAWGLNSAGQLATGDEDDRSTAVLAAAVPGAFAVRA